MDGNTENVFHDSRDDGSGTRRHLPQELGTQGFTTEVAENAINLDDMNFLFDDLPDDLIINFLAEEGQQTNIGSGTELNSEEFNNELEKRMQEFDVELENASNSMNVDESYLQAHDPLRQLFNAQSQPHSNNGLQIPAAEEGQHGLQNQNSLFNDQHPFNLYHQELPDPSHEGSLQNQIPTFNTQQVALHFLNETGNLLNLGIQELPNPNHDEGHTEEDHGGPQNLSQQQLHNQEPAVGVQNVNHEGPVHGQQADGADYFLSCGACANSKAKCSPNCVFRPHFPRNKQTQFGIISNAAGRSNLKRRVAQYDPQLRDTFFDLRYQEGLLTAKDDYGGCAAHQYDVIPTAADSAAAAAPETDPRVTLHTEANEGLHICLVFLLLTSSLCHLPCCSSPGIQTWL